MDDIFENISSLFDGLDPDMAGVVEVTGKGRSRAGGVVISAEHKRLPDASIEGSLGATYEGTIGGMEYSMDTCFQQGDATEVTWNVQNLFGMSGDSFSYGVEVAHSEGNNVAHNCEWTRELENLQHTIKLSRASSSAPLTVEPSVVYNKGSIAVGASASYDGGLARMVKAAVAFSQKVNDLAMAFTAGVDREEGNEYFFDCGFKMEPTEDFSAGAMLSRKSGSRDELTLGAEYTIEPGLSVKAKITTAGLYATAWTVLLTSHLTATLLLQHKNGVPGGGLSLAFDNTEDEEGGGGGGDE